MNIKQKDNLYSYQENTWSDISQEVSYSQVFDIIKSEKLKSKIELLRKKLSSGNKEFYDIHKKQLPAVTFAGTFNLKRRKENLKNYNSLLVLDIDKLSKEGMTKTKALLDSDSYVKSFWKSPSDRGYKGLIKIKFSESLLNKNIDFIHKEAFNVISKYFFDKHSIILDKSGSDITRLCFLSWDPEMVNKRNFQEFVIEESNFGQKLSNNLKIKNEVRSFANIKDALYNSIDKNNPYDRKLMSNIIRFLKNKNFSITSTYENWCKIGMAIASSFTFNIGKNYFIKLSMRDKEKFNEVNCINFLSNCYENRRNEVSFSSIVYLANQKGFKTKYQKNGVPEAEGI